MIIDEFSICYHFYESFGVILTYTLPCETGAPCPMFDPLEAENQLISTPKKIVGIDFNICNVANSCECDVQVHLTVT